MIYKLIWHQDSANAFDVTLCGIGGDVSRAGCAVDTVSPSGTWHLKSSDFVQASSGKLSFTHGSSSMKLASDGSQLIFGSYADNLANSLPAQVSEDQTGPQPVAGWYAKQAMVLISQLDSNPATWTWIINYSGHKL